MSRRIQNSWAYWRSTGTEYAHWHGDRAAVLALHFHDEDQLTLVLQGSRVFQVRSGVVQVGAGQCLYIPAGSPHRSLPHDAPGTSCVNAYLRPAGRRCEPALLSAAEVTGDINAVPEAALARIADRLTSAVPPLEALARPALQNTGACIGDIASRYGMSRENFTRTFSRRFGMPPHAFRIVARLNTARRRIGTGESLAAMAAELGFADHSHFGRHFRRVFGVTPVTYRDAMRFVTNVPDAATPAV
ncbi:MAG: transcriptional regulator, AraC family [Tardiphaga sp.]|nr:transcriptional regulator, AraC family [Tardiphaga sp.]